MEQKQLDEVEDSFFGEEFIDDEDFPTIKVEPEVKKTKKTTKRTKSVKKTASKKSSSKDKGEPVKMDEEKSPIKEDMNEEITITPAKEINKDSDMEHTESEIPNDDKESVKVDSPIDPWDDDEEEEGMFKEASTWKALTGIAIVLLVISVFTQGFHFSDDPTGGAVASLSLLEAEGKVLDYVNSNLLQPPFTAELQSSEDAGSLYKMTLLVSGQEIDSYITKDGNLFFPQGFDTTENLVDTAATPSLDVSADDDAVKGDVNAPVTIIEFSEYECPFCKKYVDETYSKIVKNYVDTGKVKYIFRDFPLNFHQHAQKAAEAAECAGEQDQYWEMHDTLFANQDSLTVASLKQYAQDIGLNQADFDQCLDSGMMEEEVQKDLVEGQSYGVSGTPAFFINGKMLSGAQPYEVFEQEIEAALANANNPVVVVDDSEVDEVAEVILDDTTPDVPVVIEEPEVVLETKEITLNAKKWLFDPEEIKVNKGDMIKLRIIPTGLAEFTFAIPDLGVEQQVNGNTLVEFSATKTGSFDFKCSSCEDYRGMTGTLQVK
jgi:protein-disulfide isomerase/plastocyanin